MTCYLVVKSANVRDVPVDCDVLVVFYTATTAVKTWDTSVTARSRAPTGMFEVPIPPGVDHAQVTVTPKPPLWPASQEVTLDVKAVPPTIDYVDTQGMNTDIVAVHSRGETDYNLEVPFVVGTIRDATDTMKQKAADLNARTGDYAKVGPDQQPIDFSTGPATKSAFGTPIVKVSGTNFDLLNYQSKDVSFAGTLYFVERQTTPKIVAVAHPGWPPPDSLADAVKTPIPFHVFFSPVPTWNDAYPYGATYLDFTYRYLLQKYPAGHGMLYQNNIDSPKCVFVWPMSHNEGNWIGDAANASLLSLLLDDISYFLQRKGGASWPLQDVGSISLSCYSAGATPLSNLMRGASAEFLTQKLKNVFIFDGVPAGGDDGKRAMSRQIARWFQDKEGRADRNLRLYTQHATWFDELQKYLKLPVTVPATGHAPGGAREVETAEVTLALLPFAFWAQVDRAYADYWVIHFSFPSLFMEHAVAVSTF